MASSDAGDNHHDSSSPHDDSSRGDDAAPITPHATPRLDAAGNITYVGDDGRRYVVGLPAPADTELLERIIGLCELWIEQQARCGHDPEQAVQQLLTNLERALQPPPPGR